MITVTLKRILKAGAVGFYRNRVVSLASIFVMTITLFLIGFLVFSQAVLTYSLKQIEDKVDVNVYFATNAPEENVLAVKGALEKMPEVALVEYTTKDEAIFNFKERHVNEYIILEALQEIGENPLGAYLSVKAKNASQYESIAKFLGGESEVIKENKEYIDNINYFQNKETIDRLSAMVSGINKIGYALAVLFVLISSMITFNTIRLAIYIFREEISVMRLVGADDLYIRGPFVVEGVLYGIVATVVTLILFYPVTVWLSSNTAGFLDGFNLAHYYLTNFGQIFLIILGTGVALGAISSFLAVRRYLVN